MGKPKNKAEKTRVVVVVVPERRWLLKTLVTAVVSAVTAKAVDVVWWRPAPTIVAATGRAAGTSSVVAHGSVVLTPATASASATGEAPTVLVG